MRPVQFARRLIRKLIVHDLSSATGSTIRLRSKRALVLMRTIYDVYLKAQVQGSANAQKRVKSRGVEGNLGGMGIREFTRTSSVSSGTCRRYLLLSLNILAYISYNL